MHRNGASAVGAVHRNGASASAVTIWFKLKDIFFIREVFL
ncbi:hypothetical protein LTSEUGA_0623 [Salmonella enterica subsp. enterica serovar Uganda str. R8-3404]|uniref:Uncharacterized protein n=1 Tax=Salmonella enterica subsp. enterica serovar Uganda str. R8-3404 TaxID=913083 RepID=A0A6C8H834_SALET|nr:hypothetical protein LTSEUGA_0623 [Salmonella enterica subsp. enterica serovar Uganda str. R8-3404]